MSQSLTVNLPSELYVRIKERADDAKRTIEEEAVEMLAVTAGCAPPRETIQVGRLGNEPSALVHSVDGHHGSQSGSQ